MEVHPKSNSQNKNKRHIYRKITRKPNKMPSIKYSLNNYHTNNEKKAFLIADQFSIWPNLQCHDCKFKSMKD